MINFLRVMHKQVQNWLAIHKGKVYLNEDVCTSKFGPASGMRLAPRTEAAKWSMEEVFSMTPVGVHKPWLHQSPATLTSFLEYCPDARLIFPHIRHQSFGPPRPTYVTQAKPSRPEPQLDAATKYAEFPFDPEFGAVIPQIPANEETRRLDAVWPHRLGQKGPKYGNRNGPH